MNKGMIFLLGLSISVVMAAGTARILQGSQVKNGSGTINVNSSGTITVPNLTGTLVTLDGIQTLTNKTLTTPVLDIASLTEQGSTPSTPSAGTKKIYAKNDGKLYTLSSAGAEVEVGSGAGAACEGSMLENCNFEESTVTTGWTVAGSVTAAASTGVKLKGAKSIKLTPSSVNGEIIRQVIDMTGTKWTDDGGTINMEAYTYVYLPAAVGPFQICIGYYATGTFTDVSCETVAESDKINQWVRTPSVFMTWRDLDPAVRIKSTSSTSEEMYIDEFYLERSKNIGNSQQIATDYTNLAGYNGYGSTNTRIMRFDSTLRSSVASGIFTYADSASLGGSITINKACFARASFSILSPNDTSTHTLGISKNSSQLTTTIASITAADVLSSFATSPSASTRDGTGVTWSGYLVPGDVIRAHTDATVPQDDFNTRFNFECTTGTSGKVVGADQTNYAPRSFTPSTVGTQGWGTLAAESCTEARDGKWMIVNCRITAGTVAASETRMTLPGGNTISSEVTSLRLAEGYWARGNTSTSSVKRGTILMNGGLSYVNFSIDEYAGARSPIAAQQGSDIFSNSDVIVLYFKVPIQAWRENGKAPQLINSVVCLLNGTCQIAAGRITNNGTTCTVASELGDSLGTCTRNGNGDITQAFTTAFSSAPFCTCNSESTTYTVCTLEPGETTASSVGLVTVNPNIARGDGTLQFFCIGPK